MSDWYVSSVAYAAVPQWAASTAYTVGQFVRPTAATFGREHVYRCTTAGTSGGTEPTWQSSAPNNNATVTSGTAVFTNVTGQSTYGWSAAAGTLMSIAGASGTGTNRNLAGDRVFISSDHGETNTLAASQAYQTNAAAAAFGLCQFICVNRAGSVPPVAADITTGAAITCSGTNMLLEPYCNVFWQGISFSTSHATSSNIYFASSGLKSHFFKDCTFRINSTSTTARVTANGSVTVTFDNCTFQFGHVNQMFSSVSATGYYISFTWLNTPSALVGATLPTTLFGCAPSIFNGVGITCRGVDLSAFTGNLLNATGSGFSKILLDSCKIAAGVTRLGSTYLNAGDDIELVNCFDGSSILHERYTPAGAVTTDRSTYLSSGAQDDVGNYSLKLVSTARSDKFTFPLDSFWLDVGNTAIGSSKTATVEIVSSASLNNDDISLLLEYPGAASSSVASFASTLPAVTATATALPTSSATWTWTGPAYATWNPADIGGFAIVFSNGNLTANSNNSSTGTRATVGYNSGKFYFEITLVSVASCAMGLSLITNTYANDIGAVVITASGTIRVNGSASGSSIVVGSGSVAGIAVDLTNSLIWFRAAPSGNWNGSGTANPATGAGGISISSLAGTLYPYYQSSTSGSQTVTANFGASAFSGAVPSGFASGWSAIPTVKQYLSTTFTPQTAGRVRGLVRLGKTSTTVWVNPKITIA